jgi:hypothetical protein
MRMKKAGRGEKTLRAANRSNDDVWQGTALADSLAGYGRGRVSSFFVRTAGSFGAG